MDKETLKELKEEFDMLWESYVMEDDERLTKDAQQLKNNLITLTDFVINNKGINIIV